MIEAGSPAPDFTASTHAGETIALSALRGQKVALYFYPKDDTPGCTKQACSLRDGFADLKAAGITVIGVSPDNSASHEKFAAKYTLPFPLLPDPDQSISNLYGTWGERSLYGRKYMGIARTTFLIDEEGTIVKVIKKPKVDDHATDVLKGFGLV